MKLKTLDINALEWFDKINGNSYFAGIITINYAMKGEKHILMPFEYGYGNQYEWEALRILQKNGYIPSKINDSIYTYCNKNKVILRSDIKRNCLKRELINLSI